MPERVVTVPASPTASPISRPFSIISMTGFRRATRKDSMRPTTNGDGGSDPLRNLSVMRTHPTSTLFRKSSPSVSASSPATASGNSPVMISVLPPPMSKTSTVPAPPGTRPSRSDTAPRKLMRPSSSPDRMRGRVESISSALSRNFCPFRLSRRTLVAAAVIPSGFSGRIASTKPAMATSVRSTAAERSWCDSSTPSPSRVMTMRRSTVSVRAPSQSATRSLVELVPRSRDASRRWSFTPVPALSLELPLAPQADDARLLVPGLNALAGLNRQPVRQVRVKAFYRARAPARHAPAGHPRGDGLPRDRAGQFHLKRFELSLVLLEPRSRLGLFFETPGDGPRPRGALDRPELLCGVRATEPEERGRRAAAAFERKGQDHGGHAVRAAARHENTSLRQLAHLARDDFHVGGFRQLQPGERGPYSRRDHVKRAEGVFRPQGVRHYRRGSLPEGIVVALLVLSLFLDFFLEEERVEVLRGLFRGRRRLAGVIDRDRSLLGPAQVHVLHRGRFRRGALFRGCGRPCGLRFGVPGLLTHAGLPSWLGLRLRRCRLRGGRDRGCLRRRRRSRFRLRRLRVVERPRYRGRLRRWRWSFGRGRLCGLLVRCSLDRALSHQVLVLGRQPKIFRARRFRPDLLRNPLCVERLFLFGWRVCRRRFGWHRLHGGRRSHCFDLPRGQLYRHLREVARRSHLARGCFIVDAPWLVLGQRALERLRLDRGRSRLIFGRGLGRCILRRRGSRRLVGRRWGFAHRRRRKRLLIRRWRLELRRRRLDWRRHLFERRRSYRFRSRGLNGRDLLVHRRRCFICWRRGRHCLLWRGDRRLVDRWRRLVSRRHGRRRLLERRRRCLCHGRHFFICRWRLLHHWRRIVSRRRHGSWRCDRRLVSRRLRHPGDGRLAEWCDRWRHRRGHGSGRCLHHAGRHARSRRSGHHLWRHRGSGHLRGVSHP